MRIRTLPDNRIPGTESVRDLIPNFDFYRINQVLSAKLLPAESGGLHSLDVEFFYDGGFSIGFRFIGIRQLVFPTFCPKAFVSEIEVDDLSGDQLEGIGFQLRDCGQSDFCVQCKRLEMTAINAVFPDS